MSIKNLLIIADDLGLHKSVNDGIVFLLKEGKVDGASLMPNGQAFDDAINGIMTVEPPQTLNISIHFVLVEERSLTGLALPKSYKIFFVKYLLGLIKLSDIEKELRAQLDKCINAGVKLSFINSHQHLHLLPGIMRIVIKLAIESQIPYIRIVSEPIKLSGGKLFRKSQLLFLNFLSKLAKNKIQKAGLQCNDFFVGFVNAGNMGTSNSTYVRELAEKYPDKIIEFGCHPGYESEELKRKYKHWGNYNWEKEFKLLITND